MKLVTLVCAATALLSAAPAVAVADTIVIEAFSGARPDDADQWLGPVEQELARRGVVEGAALVERLERHVSREIRTLDRADAAAASANAARAYEALVDGNYNTASAAAQQALDVFREAPWPLAQDAALRDAQFTALVVLARAQEVLGNHEAAFTAAAEVYRTFPDREVSTRQFDPRVKELHERVGDRLAAKRAAAIEISVDDVATNVYVNERLVGRGTVTVGDLVPGVYRVFTTRGAEVGRLHEVDVAENDTAKLQLRWELEASIHTANGKVTLRCEGGVLTAREIALVRDVARRVSANEIIVIGVRRVDARRSLVAYTVAVSPPSARYAALPVEPFAPDDQALVRFAALLVDDAVDAAGVALSEPLALRPADAAPPPAPPAVQATVSRPAEPPRWPYVLGGLGIAAGGIGAAMLWTSDELVKQSNKPITHIDQYDLRTRADSLRKGGIALSVVGATAVGIGVYGLLRWTPPSADEPGPGLTGIAVDRQSFWVTGAF